MPERHLVPADRLEAQLADLKPALSPAAARTEALRCLYCHDAPCVAACPTAINIPEFIRRIGNGNVVGAARTILESNILGHSCARVCPVEVLCAGSCVYHLKEEPPIAIGRLQRFATDHALAHGLRFHRRAPDTGRRIALIGAGPASLAAAHELAVRGHHCVLFEGRALPGGLNATGVAPYKLQTDVALEEVEWLLGLGGIELRTGVWVGRDLSFAQLERDFDAIFLGVGLGPDSRLALPGEDLPGSHGAVALIEQIKNQPGFALAGVERAVVIGGGNTAIDAARELRQLAVPAVTMVYRRSEAAMTGYAHELAQAKQEGVQLAFQLVPLAIEGEARVTGLRCARVDAQLVPLPGGEFVLPADLVVRATGQEKLTALLAEVPQLTLEKGRVQVDPRTHQTTHPRYFAAGDCVNGGKEVVNAVAEGQRAAQGIEAYLASLNGLTGERGDRQHG
ncbi:MAG: NAD(P)-dependent oxidoreductase [Candidatus Sericytochromatia bacterium]|nr:NAD(P)-dependent oxidoreductase [Candidatus Sericytochromatia bacterium]